MVKETNTLNFSDIPIGHFPDRSARRLLSDRENVRGLLEIIDVEWVPRIDFSRLEQIIRSFIFDDLREQVSDLVFLVPFLSESETDELGICILVEHQSTVDVQMALRVDSYRNQIWNSQRRDWASNNVSRSQQRLCPVIPIVFYTGEQRWNAPLILSAIMDILDELSRFVPKFDILLLDVKGTDSATLTKTDHPFGWLLTVLQKEHESKEALSTALTEAISHINTLGEEQAYQRRTAISYLASLILHRRPSEQREELITLVAKNIQHPSDREELEKMAQTTADILHKQGREEGETRAKQTAVLKLLQIRFDSVPEPVNQKITSMRNLSHLDSLFEKAATAQTLDEIDLENHKG